MLVWYIHSYLITINYLPAAILAESEILSPLVRPVMRNFVRFTKEEVKGAYTFIFLYYIIIIPYHCTNVIHM